MIDAPEVCDGADLDGATCLTGTEGTPSCGFDCTFIDRSSCTPTVPCGGPCPGGSSCVGGTCTCSSPFEDLCDDSCVSIVDDPMNCGGCDVVCDGATPVCAGGVCLDGCPAWFTARGGRCVDPDTDNRSCGTPAVDCTATGDVCVDGMCGDPKVPLREPAACNGGPGLPIIVNDPGADSIDQCAAELASVTFRRAVCSCTGIALSQTLIADGFSSTNGPYDPDTPGLGAGVGANGDINVSQDIVVYGSLTASGSDTCGGSYSICAEQLLVRQDVAAQNGVRTNNEIALTCEEISLPPVQPAVACGLEPNLTTGGNVQAQGGNIPPSSFSQIAGDLVRETGASLPTGLPVGGMSIEEDGIVVEDPCDCSEELKLPVASVVESHACSAPAMGETILEACAGANNDNFEAGLSPDIFDVNNPVDGDSNVTTGRIDLPCGEYYFTNILANAGSGDSTVTIAAHGNTAIYIGGDIDTQRQIKFIVEPQAQLDIFVRGQIKTISPLSAGSVLFPSRTRIYVANENDEIRAVDFNQGGQVAGNFYAPDGQFFASDDVELFGALLAGSVGITQNLEVHYDSDIVGLEATCQACGNGVLEQGEACDGDAVGGMTCADLDYDAGVLSCTDSCTLDVSDCRLCGDGRVDAPEECDGSVPAGSDCEDLGFADGDTACTASCELDTTECISAAVCGDGVVDGGEDCEPTLGVGSDTCADLGFDRGALGCSDDCRFDTSACQQCGNGAVEGDEVCDGDAGLMSVECPDGTAGEVSCSANCDAIDESSCVESCDDCRDCANQACLDDDGDGIKTCGSCVDSSDCCAPLLCFDGTCVLFVGDR